MALTLGPDGQPDEAACAFIGAHLLFWTGVIVNTISDHWLFPLLDFAAAEGGLVSIYTAFVTARSRWRSP